jgi:hypothetical protein
LARAGKRQAAAVAAAPANRRMNPRHPALMKPTLAGRGELQPKKKGGPRKMHVTRDKTQDEMDEEIPHDHDQSAGAESADPYVAAPEATTENAPQVETPQTIGGSVTAPTTIVSPC